MENLKHIKSFEAFINESKVNEGTFVKRKSIKKLLGIAADKKIADVYSDPAELAKDLVAKVGKEEAVEMLAFASNIGIALFKDAAAEAKKM